MIIYSSSALEFRDAVDNNKISDIIEEKFIKNYMRKPAKSEKNAWTNSMQYMERIIRKASVPDSCGILIEYVIPTTSKRIDFIITGKDEVGLDNYIIVELKQWEFAEATDMPGVVLTFIGGGKNYVTHPSYQAWSYKQFLSDMNEGLYSKNIKGYACAYLHNYKRNEPEPLLLPQYKDVEAEIFFKYDIDELKRFLKKHVCQGNGINTMYLIANGRLRPSKKLMDYVGELFKGNHEFTLIDEQKIAFETIVKEASAPKKKTVIIVKGGAGTGKSVISMNAFGHLLQKTKLVKFVAPNAAFRNVMLDMLQKNDKNNKMRIKNLFSGSGNFIDTPPNFYDVLIVDEAHRLKDGTAYMYNGDNQAADIIKAAKISVMFIDDNQRIRPEDIGSISEIKRVAEIHGADIIEMTLNTQFRCSGAEGFLNWIDDVFQIKSTANYDGWDKESFEFKMCETPIELLEMIKKKDASGYKSRMLAGYAWNWTSIDAGNKNGEIDDVSIPEHNFAMPWNGRAISTSWAIHPEGINQIGCVHTSQGLEFDYVGVIIGYDLKYDKQNFQLYADFNEYKDFTGKKGLKYNRSKLTELIKNIYKILISRSMKGCYIYCRDNALQEYLKKRLEMLK